MAGDRDADSGVRAFLEQIRVAHHERTVAAYRTDLADLRAFLERRPAGESVGLARARRAHLEAYLEAALAAGRGPATVRRRAVTIRLFYRFLVATGRRPDNPADRLRPPGDAAARRADRPSLTRDERDALLAGPPQAAPPRAWRDHAIVHLIAAGVGVSAVAALTIHDVDLDGGTVGAAIPATARPAVQSYLRVRRRLVGASPALFVNDRGERLTRQGIWLIVQRVARATGSPRWARGARLDTRLLTAMAETPPAPHDRPAAPRRQAG